MKQQKNTITDEEFFKYTGVNLKKWEEYEKNNFDSKIETKQPKNSKLKYAGDSIVFILTFIVIGLIIVAVIGLIIFFIWGFFFYEDYHGSSNPDDFISDYMGGVH